MIEAIQVLHDYTQNAKGFLDIRFINVEDCMLDFYQIGFFYTNTSNRNNITSIYRQPRKSFTR